MTSEGEARDVMQARDTDGDFLDSIIGTHAQLWQGCICRVDGRDFFFFLVFKMITSAPAPAELQRHHPFFMF